MPFKFRDPGADPSEAVPGWDWGQYEKAAQRVARMQTFELLSWVDAAGTGMARAFSDHGKDGNLDSLEEISTAIMTLWALKEELRLRALAQLDPPMHRV